MENSKVEEKVFNEIKRKFEEKGYDNILKNYRVYDVNVSNETKISIDFLSIDRNTKMPLLAFELKRIQNIEEIQYPSQKILKEISRSIKGIKTIYKNIKYLEYYLIIFDKNNKNKIFEVNIQGEYKQIRSIDDILNKSNKTINAYITSKEEAYDGIKKYSKIFIHIFIIIFICLFILFILNLFYSNLPLNFCFIKYLFITLGIIYGLLIFPYVKEVNFWGLQIKNFDIDK